MLPPDKTRLLLWQRRRSGAWWIVVVTDNNDALLGELYRRYYMRAPVDHWQACHPRESPAAGEPAAITCRREHMSVGQLQWVLEQFGYPAPSTRTLESATIVTPYPARSRLAEFARIWFDELCGPEPQGENDELRP